MLGDNLPGFLTEIPELADLLAAEQPEIHRLEKRTEAMLGEFSISTFTEATAAHWERLVGLEPAPGWELERRRERVRARLLATSPMSPAAFKEIVERLAGTEIELTEDAVGSRVTVKFVGEYGVSPYIEDIKAELGRILPLHLWPEYEFVYFQHRQMGAYTHGALGEYTHGQIRNGKLNGQ